MHEDYGLTMKDVAEILSVDRNTVSAYLSGKQKLKVEQLISLASSFRISPCSFFMEVDEFESMEVIKARLDEKDKLIEEKDRLIESLISVTRNLDRAMNLIIDKRDGAE